jgi:hypothetical protein
MSKCAKATTMTAEVSPTKLTKSRRPAPAYRKPNQTRAGRLRQGMVAGYVQALGGRVSPIVMQDITRAVDLVMLAMTARAELAAGKTTINDVVKLEGAADRAVRRLNLPTRGSAAAVMDLHDHVARRAAERAKASSEGTD